jgi:hypothetical protein
VDTCRAVTPKLEEIVPGHFVSCHRATEITLKGIGK